MGLHSFTILLNVSTFGEMRWAHEFPPVYETGWLTGGLVEV